MYTTDNKAVVFQIKSGAFVSEPRRAHNKRILAESLIDEFKSKSALFVWQVHLEIIWFVEIGRETKFCW
jgi:hypothetical protein